MRKIILSMQVTLDGFIAGPNDEMDWLVSSGDEWKEMFKDLASSTDTFLLGGKMYPGYSAYWRSVLNNPAAPPDELAYAQLADRTPHIVFSRTLSSVDWKNTRIATDVEQEIQKLRQVPGKNIMVWGGATFASSLIRLGVIDEYRITVAPVLLCSGKVLFNNLEKRSKLTLVSSQNFDSGAVLIRYQSSE